MSTLRLAVVLAGIFILLVALTAVGKIVAVIFGIAIIVLALMSSGSFGFRR